MKDKVLAHLKLKYKGKSLSNTFLDSIATKIAAKITEESEIEEKVNDLDEVIQETISEGDRRVSDALKPKTKPAPKTTEKTDDDDDATADPDMPKWAKQLQKSLEGLGTTVSGIVKEKQTQTIQSQLEAKMKDLKIPLNLLKGRVPEKEEDIDTVLGEIETDWNEMKGTGDIPNPLNSLGQPPAGGGSRIDGKVVTADIDAWAKQNEPPKQN